MEEFFSLQHNDPNLELYEFIKELGFTNVILNTDINLPNIVVPEANLAIEYSELQSNINDLNQNINFYKNKMIQANKNGYQLITMFEDEYKNSVSKIHNILRHKLGKTETKLYARNTKAYEIYNISSIEEFYESNHIQGWDKGSSITLALVYNNTYVAMMSFEKYKENSVYLTRFATSTQVVGGASKLFSYFLKLYTDINEIISFADLRWSDGNLYNKLNFKLVDTLQPDYRYVVDGQRKHKFNFRKKNLKKMFGDILDTDSMTEKEVMIKMGIPRSWDCGKLKYVYTR